VQRVDIFSEMELQQVMNDVTSNTPSADSGMRTQRMGTRLPEEQQMKKAISKDDPLTMYLMEKICDRENLNQAYKRVKANKGAPGVDKMTVDEMRDYIAKHKERLLESLLSGSYQPQPVREVEIPKPGGGVRQLGVPTVIDRLVQQAILQVLQPIFEAKFSESSFGFRPNRSAHQAVKRAQGYVRRGNRIVVDMDLEKFFDRVNHDILMSKLAKVIEDKRLLRIIRAFLNAGIMRQGVCIERVEGTPQGGPLSPLLSNILLDELDKELERRGHRFCRYADDCNVYVKTLQAGERVMESLKQFLKKKLRLKVNEGKSGVSKVTERQFLGFRILQNGKINISKKSEDRVKEAVRTITKRNRGKSLELVISELNKKLGGWVNYFKLIDRPDGLRRLDCWIRRKLRCYRLKQCKKYYSIVKFLLGLGVSAPSAYTTASSGKGWWRLSATPALQQAMSNAWFDEQGLLNLEQLATSLKIKLKPPYATSHVRWCERTGS
jgi:RNA-directed DNA polymerase